MTATDVSEEKSFEAALTELEEVVQQMEKGELPLEESMRLYEKGVKLTAYCNSCLKTAKLKLEELRGGSDEA